MEVLETLHQCFPRRAVHHTISTHLHIYTSTGSGSGEGQSCASMPGVACRTGPRWGSSEASPGVVVLAAAAAAVGVVAGAGVAGLVAVLWIRRLERAKEEGASAALTIFAEGRSVCASLQARRSRICIVFCTGLAFRVTAAEL